MITDRDRRIIKFVEMHKSITINQCAILYFYGHKQAYDQARKRLQVIHKEGLLKRYRKDPKHEAVYYIDKKLKVHDIKLIDVLSNLATIKGFKVLEVKKETKFEMSFQNITYIVDGTLVIKEDNKFLPILIEIDYTHYTSKEKILDIIEHLEEKKKTKFIFIVVKLTQEELKISNIGTKSILIEVPWKLNEFDKISAELRSAIQH